MRSSRSWRCADRAAQFEPFEPRLLMAADPAGDCYIDYFVENQQIDEIRTTLADAHDQTGLSQARAEYGFTGSGQTVAVIDTGIAYDHVALGGGFGPGYQVVGGFDFSGEQDGNPYDDGPHGSHGTHVAGIIGGNNALYPGVAPGVDMVGLRVFDDEGLGHFSWVEDALAWVHENRNAFDNPITTVNLSLGAEWNADEPPDWATLEEHFAQLHADGIFVAVAAGNDYLDLQQPGLTYPAASPYVVPVGSVDDGGNLSYFSQRHSRMIAAPGRSVRSTVPDYAGDHNGIADDFARYSGTSMAAPYVAGAAVLLREAYQFVGLGNVTQDTIYDLMVSTADTTDGGYHRLNIDRALDQIMPADDFGSSRSAAHGLGTLADAQTLAGTIDTLGDSDWFTFTAGATGSVQVSLTATGQWTPQWEMPAGSAAVPPAAETFSIDVTAGKTYDLGLTTGNGLGRYTLDFTLEALPGDSEWGAVDQRIFDDYRVGGAGREFMLSAANDGILTLEALFRHAEGDVDLELFAVTPGSDGNGVLLATSYGMTDAERIDVNVSAGDTFRLRAYVYGGGSNESVDFRATNLVSQSGGLLRVGGTSGNDRFTFAAGAIHRVSVNDTTYEFPSATIDSVEFNGGAGNDSIELTGNAGNDRAVLRSGSVELVGAGYQVVATSMENVTVHGGGGTDRAVFYDSAGNDTFIAKVGRTRMIGSGMYNDVRGFRSVCAYATAGGKDVARLFDSRGNDLLVAKPRWMTLSGSRFTHRAEGFDEAHAYSTAGGVDTARLFDSAGNDTFVADPTQAVFSGQQFYNRVKHFEQVHAYALVGGTDSARLVGSNASNPGDGDTLRLTSAYGVLSGEQFYNRAKFFEQFEADARGGQNDRAYLDDSVGDDLLGAAANWVRLAGAQRDARAYGFEFVRAASTAGGSDRADLAAVDYLLELAGDWRR
ncbi:MAG: S8 family serine peptidase [Candidatus Nealsonbacteria bacterium]|nr:S8 family serine peptidase [Candidatus Nealsonbacteria bacterium]